MSRTQNKEYMLQLVQQWRQSDLSQAKFAKLNGVHLLKFRYWIQKSKDSQVQESPFVELTGRTSQDLILRYPNGVELSLSAQTPVQLIRSLIYL